VRLEKPNKKFNGGDIMIELFLIFGIAQLLIPLLILVWQYIDRSTGRIYWLFKTALSLAYLITIAAD
jgi:hypothetical protein